jgi:hypothetical protein
MAKAKTTTKTAAKKSSAKAAEAAPVNAATNLLHTLCKSLAEAIVADPKIAKLADSYGLSFVGEEADSDYEEEEDEDLDSEEDEEFEEEEEDEEEAPKSKKAASKKAPAKGGKKKKALTADDIIEILDGDDAEAADAAFNDLDDEDMIREIAVTLKLVKAKAAAKTDADTLTEMIGEHFGIGEEEEDEEEGIDPDEMSEAELLEFVIEHKLATKVKAKKMDEDELRALVEEFLEEEEEEDEEEEEEDEEEFDDEEEEEEDEDEFDDEFDEE